MTNQITKANTNQNSNTQGTIKPKAVLFSRYDFNWEKITTSKDYCQLKLNKDETIFFYGQIYVQVLKGSIWCVGSTINSENEEQLLCSPLHESPLAFKCDSNTGCKIKIRMVRQPKTKTERNLHSLLYPFDLLNVEEKLTINETKVINTKYGEFLHVGIPNFLIVMKQFVSRKHPLFLNSHFPQLSWTKACNSICETYFEKKETFLQNENLNSFLNKNINKKNSKSNENDNNEFKNSITLVCGKKSCGRSTFLRYLSNRFNQNGQKIAWVDLDLNNPEFTQTGFCSITIVDRALFDHLSSKGNQQHNYPHFSYYFGDSSVKTNPKLFYHILKVLETNLPQDMPILINCSAYGEGYNQIYFSKIIKYFKPTYLVYFSAGGVGDENEKKQILDSENYPQKTVIFEIKSLICSHSVNYFGVIKPKIAKLHSGKLITYFLNNQSKLLIRQKPYSVPFNQIYLISLFHKVPNNLILKIFNARIVSIGKYINESKIKNKNLFTIINEIDFNQIQCHGLALIRAIDPTKKIFYINTPLSLQALKYVNLFILGNIQSPIEFFIDGVNKKKIPYIEFKTQNEELLEKEMMHHNVKKFSKNRKIIKFD
ncbi:polynucleotide 5'-hydroxyl-kinase nol9 [Anaeramoeba flamelloides]|uniref:Polynucleotide 5'-hydroxyl-kinase nol9 n=1 Tax=Anaeramoeba flamelloides TaxID=1746091 RepID=A0AAV7Z5T2_9EUKA|nr:polynucleotide 5'-hydroxyl-kinase nol9 [Anaeramoeba flamelloides]